MYSPAIPRIANRLDLLRTRLHARAHALLSSNGWHALARGTAQAGQLARSLLFHARLRTRALANPLVIPRRSLAALAELTVAQGRPLQPSGVDTLVTPPAAEADRDVLAALLTLHGSDKSTRHDYHLAYGAILAGKRHQPLRILHIGLRATSARSPFKPKASAHAGASLRAFRDWAPRAAVFGADFNRDLLFSEDRINTFFVDQASPSALESLGRHFEPRSLDLIIDDGQHDARAGLNTLNLALTLVKPDGWVVIENVRERDLPTWQIAFTILAPRYTCRLLRMKAGCLCIFRRRPSLAQTAAA